MDILFLQGPHKKAHSISVSLPPLGPLAVAGYLREKGFEVNALDCCINQWGWKTTEKALKLLDPPVVGVGGPIVWANENLELCSLIKKINPNCITIYGGTAVTLAPEVALFKDSPVDFIISGEGETTTEELLQELKRPPERRDFSQIRGLIYQKNDHLIQTNVRPLVKNLDDFPIPAYDLLPIDKYGREFELYNKGISVYHSRGCTGGCKFCSCWRPMGAHNNCNDADVVIPSWRTKSVKKTLDELKYIQDTWNRELFAFTDDTWNINAKWNEEFADRYYKEYGLTTDWFAFMRADLIRRDIRNGVFQKLYKSRLRQMIVGFECADQGSLDSIHKDLRIIKNENTINWIHYYCPELFVQGTFINGMWENTIKDFIANFKYAKRMNLDLPGFGALKPFPGTQIYDFYLNKGLLTDVKFDDYRFDNTVVPTKYLSVKEVHRVNSMANMLYIMDPKYLFQILFLMNSYRRKMHWVFLRRLLMGMFKKILSPIIKDRDEWYYS